MVSFLSRKSPFMKEYLNLTMGEKRNGSTERNHKFGRVPARKSFRVAKVGAKSGFTFGTCIANEIKAIIRTSTEGLTIGIAWKSRLLMVPEPIRLLRSQAIQGLPSSTSKAE